jgi:Carbohydrate family 9 binding domain-like
MNGFAKLVFAALLLCLIGAGKTSDVIESSKAERDQPLTVDPASPFWRGAHPVFLEKDKLGKLEPAFRTEVRTRWTDHNLFFLFICPFEELSLKPAPSAQQETNELWNWDVAEVFIGSDFDHIDRYKEFEVSPQGEWVDLDIDLHKPHHEEGWVWNSGFEKMARIDYQAHIWYAALRIPFSAIDNRPVKEGNTLRINLFLSEGPASNHHDVAWQPTMKETFHVPEVFGSIRLAK